LTDSIAVAARALVGKFHDETAPGGSPTGCTRDARRPKGAGPGAHAVIRDPAGAVLALMQPPA
jgi:hypothetical protein